ncbi:2-keto-3-deoxygluconate permease [Streptococcus pluranimalium]|uniref:2-keto-3-deoxygluconate permease n=1 Tax=Streptococcus pluranimalium TaxID=82348 RepID=UPI003BF7B0C4
MKLMKSIPGGTLLIPMLISAIIHTFSPTFFNIGGLTQAMFSGEAINFILGAAVFLSGCTLKLKTLTQVFKNYGVLLLARFIISTVASLIFIKLFGLDGIWGLSAIAFICTLTSMNPTLFLALMKDYGDESDQAAFGLVAVMALPIIPMFIYGLTSPTPLNFMPILSTLFPLVLGIIIGNLDHDLSQHMAPAMGFIIIMLGWGVGANINLFEAMKAGLPGIMIAILYYLIGALPLILIEKYILKRSGASATALSTVAGLSASIPLLMVVSNPELKDYASQSAAITSLVVVCTAIIAPILCQKFAEKEK